MCSRHLPHSDKPSPPGDCDPCFWSHARHGVGAFSCSFETRHSSLTWTLAGMIRFKTAIRFYSIRHIACIRGNPQWGGREISRAGDVTCACTVRHWTYSTLINCSSFPLCSLNSFKQNIPHRSGRRQFAPATDFERGHVVSKLQVSCAPGQLQCSAALLHTHERACQ